MRRLSGTAPTGRARVLDDASGFLRADLAALRLLVDGGEPGERTVPDAWGAGGISFDDLDASVAYGTEVCSEHDGYDGAGPPPQPGPVHQPCFSCEVLRIRRLASDGWPPLAEDPSPIFVDVGLGDYRPDWPILDGNHRLAAALWRGDTTIDVAVGGDWECAVHLLVDAPSDAARASSPDGPA